MAYSSIPTSRTVMRPTIVQLGRKSSRHRLLDFDSDRFQKIVRQ